MRASSNWILLPTIFPFYTSQITKENQRFYGVFKGYKIEKLVRNRLNGPIFKSLISQIFSVFVVKVTSNQTSWYIFLCDINLEYSIDSRNDFVKERFSLIWKDFVSLGEDVLKTSCRVLTKVRNELERPKTT